MNPRTRSVFLNRWCISFRPRNISHERLTDQESEIVRTGIAESDSESHNNMSDVIRRVNVREIADGHESEGEKQRFLPTPFVGNGTEEETSYRAADEERTLSRGD